MLLCMYTYIIYITVTRAHGHGSRFWLASLPAYDCAEFKLKLGAKRGNENGK